VTELVEGSNRICAEGVGHGASIPSSD
jgi:hypothetical protein